MNFQHCFLDAGRGWADYRLMAKAPKKPQPKRRRIFLREWRKYRNLTQEQLAERVGWAVSNVSQLEQARQGYSQDGLEALAMALQCDPGQLLNTDPTRDEGIWPLWETAKPGERQMIVGIAKTIIGKTEQAK